ncbi:MAG: hypothetical protein EBX09_06625 [Actinobacteria bacterium]|jgi:hypothetical protein|nr:hypothetical protein [Actinomycetota bacterium]NCX76693.1 hypothetical protein [Actinomycetota bacterium]
MNDKAHYFVVAGRRMPDGTVLLEIDDEVRVGGCTIYDHTDERWHNCEQLGDFEDEEAIQAELTRRLAHQAPVTEVTLQKLTEDTSHPSTMGAYETRKPKSD